MWGMPTTTRPETDAIGFSWRRSPAVQGRIVVSWYSPAPLVDPQGEARRLLRQSASFAFDCGVDPERLYLVENGVGYTAGSTLFEHTVQLTPG